MDWFITIPRTQRSQARICDGILRVYDADTDNLLTELPIHIVNSAVAVPGG
jgi:hypothetical protein